MASDTFNYTTESMGISNPNLASSNTLKASQNISDDFLRSSGLYSKSEIDTAKFTKFSRFGRVLDPYGRLNSCREYLFFTKPDLHICIPWGSNPNTEDVYRISGASAYNQTSKKTINGLRLNPQLSDNSYFMDLLDKHPEVVKELQYSANSSKNPFNHLLSFSCSSNLDLPGATATTLDNPSTIFGTSYEYLKDAEEADENHEFSLEFTDTKYLDTYHFFKAYSDYHIARKSGLVTPPSMDYYRYRRLHNVMGIYKFIVAEDSETIIYWAYFWGVYPVSCPREAFADPSFPDGLTFSVSFKSAFMEDMNPVLLYQFNQLMGIVMDEYKLNKDNWLKVVKEDNLGALNMDPMVANSGYGTRIDGTLPRAALVDGRVLNGDKRPVYRLRWYG